MCGVIGVIGIDYACDVAVQALTTIQGRGLEAAAVGTISDGQPIILRQEGMIDNLRKSFQPGSINTTSAVAHTRYGTAGTSTISNVHPLNPRNGGPLIVHNGEILHADGYRQAMEGKGIPFDSDTDTEVLLRYLENEAAGNSVIDRVINGLSQFEAAYSVVILWEGHLIGACCPKGFHPLVLGRFSNGGYIFASEDAAIRVVNAEKLKFVKPGQVIVITPGLEKREFWLNGKSEKVDTAHCAFNPTYTARPDGQVWGRSVSKAREQLGSRTFREHRLVGLPELDVIVPVLDSGRDATRAYAAHYDLYRMANLVRGGIDPESIEKMDINSSHSMNFGINRGRGSRRSFMLPSQDMREAEIILKHSGDPAIIKGKRVGVGDDTVVRGTTALKIVRMLRSLGADEVHFIVFAPPIMRSCPYGGNETKDVIKLLAVTLPDSEQRCKKIEADSLFYLSLEGYMEVINYKATHCMYCFGGPAPVSLAHP